MNSIAPDLLIFGGGIAGLWTLLRARQAGYSVLLLESGALGGVQSMASQGIIHGGAKYALHGKLSSAAQAIAAMPGIWRDCLQGGGELDLSAVRVLSQHQYLWSSGSVASSVASLFASKLMKSRVSAVARNQRPVPFDHEAFHGSLYQLQEPVLDTASLMRTLAEQAMPHCWRYHPDELRLLQAGVQLRDMEIQAKRILLCAGSGNARLLAAWGKDEPAMQERPLHMVMLKGRLPEVFAHCLGASSNPRLTITSYPLNKTEKVWYLGGQLAETGVKRNPQEQIKAAKSELAELLPWVDISAAVWASLRIDRAEIATGGGKRPQDSFLGVSPELLVAWPTKLAFAPRLAAQVLEQLQNEKIEPSQTTLPDLSWPHPPVAQLPWEKVQEWS
ncbi:FAD-dependent oxidoreductase [Thiolapillus sp.]